MFNVRIATLINFREGKRQIKEFKVICSWTINRRLFTDIYKVGDKNINLKAK